MKSYLILICYVIVLNSIGQTNHVSNSGFENGGTPQCSQNCVPAFDNNISSWYNALRRPTQCLFCSYNYNTHNCGCVALVQNACSTTDWLDNATCVGNVFPYISPRYVHCVSTSPDYGEGIRQSLGAALIPGNKYTLRFRYAAGSNNCGFYVYNTSFSEHWDKKNKPSGNHKLSIGTFGGPGLFPNSTFVANQWTSFATSYTVPSGQTGLSNLILVRDFNGGAAYLDDVELLDGDCNTGDLLVSDKTYIAYEYPYEFQHITAGTNANPSTPGVVTVSPTADVTYKAAVEVTLSDGFEATLGTEFHAYIAPCGSPCPYPSIPTSDFTICDGLPINIGADAQPNLNYIWSASTTTALGYLSATNVSNPVFTPPTGVGIAIYTVTVTNNCGGSSSGTVTIHYADVSDPNPTVTASNIDMTTDYINFDLTYNPNTDYIDIQVIDGSGNIVGDYELENGVDFTTNPFHWQIPDNLRNCSTYTVNINSTNICNTNVSPTQSIVWTKTIPLTVIVPNIFTPNGDGINDEFCITFSGGDEFTFTVNDPSGGGPLFTASGTISPPTACIWDGTCFAGLSCTNIGSVLIDGGYAYILDVTGSGCGTKFNKADIVQLFSSSFRMARPDSSGGKSSNGTDSTLLQRSSIKLIPNPNNGNFRIFNESKTIYGFEIFDLSGLKILREEAFQNNSTIDISQYAAGLYFIKFFSRDGVILETHKIIKQ